MSKIQKVLPNTKTKLRRTILKRGLANKDNENAKKKKNIILPQALGATDDGYPFSKADVTG